MDNIEQQMIGTPLEEWKKSADILRRFKTTEGFQVLSEFVRNQQAYLMRAFIEGTDSAELVDLQAEMKAWFKLLGHVDDCVDSYDAWLEQTLNQMNKQQDDLVRGINNVR